jgi:hypothetical protein
MKRRVKGERRRERGEGRMSVLVFSPLLSPFSLLFSYSPRAA